MKNIAKAFLLRSLSLPTQRLAAAFLRNLTKSASKDDTPLLGNLLMSVEFLQVFLEDRIRQINFSGRTVLRGQQSLQTYLMEDQSPWTDLFVNAIKMPGMITHEETQYYEYIGNLYQGHGEAIELGPWLGKSTRHIIRGLDKNPNFIGKQLYVFDDFVWRSYMNPYFTDNLNQPNHSDFRHLFEEYVREIGSRLNVNKGKIVDYDGNENVPQIEWNGAPIEIMYIDCGRHLPVNEAWYRIFSPNLIPGMSLLIMQDWRTHRERPRRAYNETDRFTAAHPELKIVHEVKGGNIATFLYQGTTP
jgi:hypothetical protein